MRRFVVALTMAALAVAVPVAASAADACELSWSGDVRYTVDRSAGIIRVEATVWPATSGWAGECGDPYLDFPVVPGTRDLEVGSLVTNSIEIQDADEAGRSSVAVVAFQPDTLGVLESGVRVEYSMTADGDWVEFDGYSARFPIWTIGDPDRGSVSVTSGTSDGILATAGLSAGDPAVGTATFDPSHVPGWGAYASVHFGAYETIALSDEVTYLVDRSNPDPEFEIVAGSVSALDDLVDILGPPTGDREGITIVEVPEGALAGYAGRYDSGAGLVEIDASVTQATIIHELAHAWVNESVFADPWASEGLAELVTVTLEGTSADTDGLPPMEAHPVTPSGRSLVTWDSIPLDDPASEAEVEYGYDASLWVMDRVAAEIGLVDLFGHVASIVAETSESTDPMTSQEFLSGLQRELGFTDRDGTFAAFVFADGSVPDGKVEGGRPIPSPVPRETAPVGFGATELALLVAAVAAILVVIAVFRSLRQVPLGEESRRAGGRGDPDEDPHGSKAATASEYESDWAF